MALFDIKYIMSQFASFHAIIRIISLCKTRHITRWFASNRFTLYYPQHHHPLLTFKQAPLFPRLTTPLPLRGGAVVRLYLPFIVLHFIINPATSTIVSPRNSVRVVLLIAQGWRGTSLPRVNVRKEIQRCKCWAFSMKTRLQWNISWRITQRNRNTYGVVSRKPYANPG